MYNSLMIEHISHLIRHYQPIHEAAYYVFSPAWLRIFACLTLLIPLWTATTFGQRTRQTSDKFHLSTTPPPYFFKIWIVMFAMEGFMMVYAAIVDCWSPQPWWLFVIMNISTGLWAFTFNTGSVIGVDVSVLCQFINLFANEYIWLDLGNPGKNSLTGSFMGLLIRNMVAFMQGWFIAAAVLGLFIIFVYTCGMGQRTQMIAFWVIAPLVYIAFLAYNILQVGPFVDSIGLLVSMAWAVMGAALASRNRSEISELF